MAERVFITGALGFIAQRLAHHYRERGAEVRGMDVRADPAQDLVAGDVSKPGDVWGPRSRPWTILPVEMIKDGRFMLPRGGIFSPVYVDNLVEGIAAAAAKPEGAGLVFTITDGVGVPNEAFFGRYFECSERGARACCRGG